MVIAAAIAVPAFTSAQTAPTTTDTTWVASWGAAQQIPEPQNALPEADITHATIRQTVHLSAGGSALRVRLSNAFGTTPLRFTAVHVALALVPDQSAIDPATDRPALFSGSEQVAIPAGAEYVSDPIDLSVTPLTNLTVTFSLDQAPQQQTGHPGSRATAFLAHGIPVSALSMTGTALPGTKSIEHWYFLSGIDVATSTNTPSSSIVALGDSITDGHASTTNGNDRWTDVLAQRIEADPATRGIGVVNAGIGGNHLLTDGLGPNALARFNRDVLARPGAKWVILLEGVNDLGALAPSGNATAAQHTDLVQRILAAYQQIIARAHAQGLLVYGATITPYVGSDYYHPDALSEADRQRINTWIRREKYFDAVIDFDQVVRDPAHPDRLLPTLDCGDHLHPSPAGYRVMGEAIPLNLFRR
uniref:Lipolytic enzyme, G-D-S-L n=1 Tax=mine drainage metagenome TaxID=410659 RepID=E6QMS1_9ZZZZ